MLTLIMRLFYQLSITSIYLPVCTYSANIIKRSFIAGTPGVFEPVKATAFLTSLI